MSGFPSSGEDVCAQVYDAYAALEALGGPPPSEFTLTEEQLDKVQALQPKVGVNRVSAPFPTAPLIFGVPIRIVDTVEESTPYRVGRFRSASHQELSAVVPLTSC